jgi:hypothetical protein
MGQGHTVPEKSNITSIVREHKTLFIIIAVGLFLLEIEIFALAVMKSGRESRMQIIGPQEHVIYETDGHELSRFNKYYFEKTFGPFEQFKTRLVTRERPFPFRAWFVAAVGIPVGVVLLFGFMVKAYTSLFYGESAAPGVPAGEGPQGSRLERIVHTVSRFNVFVIGALVLLGVLAYWVVPNLIVDLGRIGLETLVQYKWVVLSAVLVFLALVVWIIYLRYLLAKKSIESRAEIDKYRLELEFDRNQKPPLQLDGVPDADPMGREPIDRGPDPTTTQP